MKNKMSGLLMLLLFFCLPLCLDAWGGATAQVLQLKLEIKNPGPKETDPPSIRLTISNQRESPITLVAEWPDDDDKEDYLEFARSRVKLTTDPEAQCPPYSEGGGWWGKRTLPQPTLTLEAGDSKTFELEPMKKRWLVIGLGQSVYCFPSSGRYEVTARLSVLTSTGEKILLESDRQPLIFEGLNRRARPSVATVTYINEKDEAARLDVGSADGIRLNDRFRILPSKALAYELTVVSVHEKYSEASVAVHVHERFKNHKWFPKVGARAYYWSPAWDW